MSTNEFKNRLDKIKTDYYSINKPSIFKKNQKVECAKSITTQISLTHLLNNTAYILNGTNKVYFDYTVFKTYATPEIFPHVVNHIKQLNIQAIQMHGSFETQVNWATYTISAHERYKDIFRLFSLAHTDDCIYDFSALLTKFNVYNTPTIMNIISTFITPFIDPVVISKITLHDKLASQSIISMLLDNKTV